MFTKLRLVFLVLIGTFLCAAVSIQQQRGAEKQSASIQPVSAQQLVDALKDLKGKAVLLNIWATWCAPCRQEIPDLVKLQKKYEDRGFSLVMVSTDDADSISQLIQPMLEKLGVDFPTFVHSGNDESLMNQLSSEWSGALPATFLYDQRGKMVKSMVGKRSYEQFEAAIQPLLRASP